MDRGLIFLLELTGKTTNIRKHRTGSQAMMARRGSGPSVLPGLFMKVKGNDPIVRMFWEFPGASL